MARRSADQPIVRLDLRTTPPVAKRPVSGHGRPRMLALPGVSDLASRNEVIMACPDWMHARLEHIPATVDLPRAKPMTLGPDVAVARPVCSGRWAQVADRRSLGPPGYARSSASLFGKCSGRKLDGHHRSGRRYGPRVPGALVRGRLGRCRGLRRAGRGSGAGCVPCFAVLRHCRLEV